MRAASAHEISEAGLEWAIGMFNHSQKIDASCSDGNLTSDLSFRSRYIRFPVHPVSGLPVTASTVDKPMYPDVLPGCSINAVDGGLSCSCPDSGTATLDLGAGASHFTVRFEPEKDDVDISDSTKFHWETVRITSIGCVAATGACTPSGEKAVANTANADATALTSVAVKLRPAIRRKPLAPLICGGDCELSSGFKIINTSATAGGLLIIAGGKSMNMTKKIFRPSPEYLSRVRLSKMIHHYHYSQRMTVLATMKQSFNPTSAPVSTNTVTHQRPGSLSAVNVKPMSRKRTLKVRAHSSFLMASILKISQAANWAQPQSPSFW